MQDLVLLAFNVFSTVGSFRIIGNLMNQVERVGVCSARSPKW